jgi:LmbE family N-acetylglucosaminyl deacetylase
MNAPPAVGGVLLVYAHPDDESFGNPGTTALYTSRYIPVSLVCFTHGEAGEPNGVCSPEELGNVRASELRAAADVLGISRLELWDYPDGGLEGVDDEEAIARLIETYESIGPGAIVTFSDDGITGHHDHLTVSKWATEAFWRLRKKSGGGGPSRLYWRTVPEKRRAIMNRPDVICRSDYTTIIDARDHKRTRAEAEACHATQRAHTNYADPALIEMGVVDYYIRKFPEWEGGPYEADLLGGKTHPEESSLP